MNAIDQYLQESISVQSPNGVYKYLSGITYGYIDLKGKRITANSKEWDDDDYFIKHFRSQSPQELIRSRIGICGDKTELTKYLLDKLKIPTRIYYLELKKNQDGHSFISYSENDKSYWLECSWRKPHNGIHAFNNEKDLLKHVAKEFIKESYGGGPGFINLITKPRPSGLDIHQLIALGRKGKRIMSI